MNSLLSLSRNLSLGLDKSLQRVTAAEILKHSSRFHEIISSFVLAEGYGTGLEMYLFSKQASNCFLFSDGERGNIKTFIGRHISRNPDCSEDMQRSSVAYSLAGLADFSASVAGGSRPRRMNFSLFHRVALLSNSSDPPAGFCIRCTPLHLH